MNLKYNIIYNKMIFTASRSNPGNFWTRFFLPKINPSVPSRFSKVNPGPGIGSKNQSRDRDPNAPCRLLVYSLENFLGTLFFRNMKKNPWFSKKANAFLKCSMCYYHTFPSDSDFEFLTESSLEKQLYFGKSKNFTIFMLISNIFKSSRRRFYQISAKH